MESAVLGGRHVVECAVRSGVVVVVLPAGDQAAGVITLALPGLPRLKEWAYAGFGFDFIGAAASHAFNGDGIDKIAPPFIILSVLIGSYLLRPPDRRLV